MICGIRKENIDGLRWQSRWNLECLTSSSVHLVDMEAVQQLLETAYLSDYLQPSSLRTATHSLLHLYIQKLFYSMWTKGNKDNNYNYYYYYYYYYYIIIVDEKFARLSGFCRSAEMVFLDSTSYFMFTFIFLSACKCLCRVYPLESGEVTAWIMYYVVERLCGNSTQRVLTLNAQILNKYTVEPLKEDPPRKGHCIKYLSTKDKNKYPNLSLPINIMWLEPLKRGQPL